MADEVNRTKWQELLKEVRDFALKHDMQFHYERKTNKKEFIRLEKWFHEPKERKDGES